jgi:hypothetical protein
MIYSLPGGFADLVAQASEAAEKVGISQPEGSESV